MKIKCLITGRSHIAALLQAAQARAQTATATPFGYQFASTNNCDSVSCLLELIQCQLNQCDVVVTLFRGQQHNLIGLLQDLNRFDYVEEPHNSSFSPEVQLIPCNAIEQLFARTLADLVEFAKRVGEISRKPLFVMGPPPPIGDEAHLRRHLDKTFVNRLDRAGLTADDAVISPPSFRTKLWRTLNSVYEDVARTNGCTWIPVPAAALEEDGCLARRAYGRDATHANAWYGELRLQQIEATYQSLFHPI